VRPRFFSRDATAVREEPTHFCGHCNNAGDKKPEKQIAFCMEHRIMVPTTKPVICKEFVKV